MTSWKSGLRVAFLSICLLWGARTLGDDWPQWRGPQRDGVWRETGMVNAFGAQETESLWRTSVGNGYSGPTVSEGRVFLMDRDMERSNRERVLCFDAETGESIWTVEYDCTYHSIGYPEGPRTSVACEKGFVYSLGTMGDVYCIHAGDGEIRWRLDLKDRYSLKMPVWGLAASPLLWKGLLLLQAGAREGACMVALDKTSGKEVWRALEDGASYSSPIIVTRKGVDVLVCWTAQRVVGLDPLTGRLFWAVPMPPGEIRQNVATPVLWRDYLFLSSFFDGALLLKLSEDGRDASKVWRRKGANERDTDALHCCISTPVLWEDYIYGIDSYGKLRCLEIGTGDRIWEEDSVVPLGRWATAHLVRNGAKIWIFSEKGELIVARFSPKGYEELDRTQVIDVSVKPLDRRGGVCWAHPAFAGGRLYARNDRELVCVELGLED